MQFLRQCWQVSSLPCEHLDSTRCTCSGAGWLSLRRLLRTVAVAQTALTMALLAGAGLLIRTMSNIAKVQSGFNTSRVLTMSVTAVQGDWRFHLPYFQRTSALPGVESAAFAWGVPLTGNNWQSPVEFEGQPAPAKASDRAIFPLRSVTPGYFDLQAKRLPERDFRDTDIRTAPPVAIVNQALVDRCFSTPECDWKENSTDVQPGTSAFGKLSRWWLTARQ